jgi:polyadenylate-binding protein
LEKAMLYVSDLQPGIEDKELASTAFASCLPVRLQIARSDESAGQSLSGTVEFQTKDKAEKALATIQTPRLSINEVPTQDPKPEAKPRLVKQLPYGTEDGDVYDLFRPYGAIHSANRILTNPAGVHTGFRGMALVVFYKEEDAQRAQEELHCAEVEGKTISVVVDVVARRSGGSQSAGFSASAAPFVPGGSSSIYASQSMSPTAPAFHPPIHSHQPQKGHTVGAPGSNLQYSSQAATFVDPCNLFCKNLDPSIDSNELFGMFKEFGMIISARVMRDERGLSREFGFVSFRRAEDASQALAAMNGTQQGSKQMIVRLHEPKSARQEKLSQKFGTAYASDSSKDQEITPQGSDTNDSMANRDGSPRPRRKSNSYYRAAASGENGQVDLAQMQSMNATLCGDILRGGFSRKIKEFKDVNAADVERIVETLTALKLPEAVEALNNPADLAKRVAELRSTDIASPIATPEDVPAGTERERMLQHVKEALPEDSRHEKITDMIDALPKKERAMALFNQDYLRTKIMEAKAILDLPEEEQQPAKTDILSTANGNGASAASYSLADLGKLPASEIVKLAQEPRSIELPLPSADPSVVKETDEFIDSIKDLAPHDQKQKLGDQLFKKIRTFGIKGAPKITISLLDSEDLRSLAHLMNSYPDCLREKVALQGAKSAAK